MDCQEKKLAILKFARMGYCLLVATNGSELVEVAYQHVQWKCYTVAETAVQGVG